MTIRPSPGSGCRTFRIQVTSLGDNGNPQPPAGDNWYSLYTTVTLSVTSPYQSWTCTGYIGTGDIGSGPETSFQVTVTQASTIIWNWQYAGNQLSLGVISAFGTPTPTGLSLYTPGQQVTASVQASITVDGDTYACIGYAGTGSVPVAGTGNSVTFTILQNSTVTWNWQKQGGGTNLLTINSPFPPLPGYTRLYDDELIDVSAQSPVEGDGYRWVCTGFTSTGSSIQAPSTASSFSFTITRNTTINFLWDIYYRLDVTSGDGDELYGDPQLSIGGGPNQPVSAESWWSTDMPFRLSVTTPYTPEGASGVRYTCLGWEGVGNIPQDDTSTSEVVFFLDQPTHITFLWETQYKFTVYNPRNLPGPSPSVGTYWHPEGTVINGSCIDSIGYYTSMGYEATGSLTSSSTSSFQFTINAPTTVEWIWQLNLPDFITSETLDDNTTGLYTSLAREPQTGYPWIAYFDSVPGDLVVMNWDGSQWIKQTVATIGTTGQYASLVLDNQLHPHIAYYDATEGDLWYANWTGVNWERILVDADGDVGRYASISLITTPNGIVPAIAYYDDTNGILKYAQLSGSGFAVQDVTAPAQGDRGKYCSLAFDGFQNVPSIAYYDASEGDLMFATRIGGVWFSEVVSSVGDVGRFASLSFNADNEPGIAYYDLTNRDLKFILKSGNNWLTPVDVDSAGDVGQFCSLKFTATNIPMISYADYGRESLKFAFFTGVEWVTQVLDDQGTNVGWYTSLGLDAFGNPGISYATATQVRYKAVETPTEPQNPGDNNNIGTDGGGGGGCFVATSAFGTMASGAVQTLCSVRDSGLNSAIPGSALVSLYYAVSPTVADRMRMSASSRALVRALLSE
ncbi:MAG: CFI-box-CTERM domain-containing protein [Planctomycetota bacterium]|nr:CFI-box-CTERM domain-containing protein [Planctomycetota bacterium]